MKKQKTINKKINKKNYILDNLTLSKLLGALVTALLVASLKYYISGNFTFNYSDFYNNVGIGLLAWTLKTGITGWFTEHLVIRGINFNLRELIYDHDTIKIGDTSIDIESKPKLYYAMDSEDDMNKRLNKGKGIDRKLHPTYDSVNYPLNPEANNDTLNKGKEVVESTESTNSNRITWSKLYPGMDKSSMFPPQGTNPGPGFNVPGGEVPIGDSICQHIDYNTRILSQLKKMDLETAIEQRNNNFMLAKVMESKLEYAKNALSNIPTIITTEYEFNLKNQILKDLDSLSKNKNRAEARIILLTSRIDFIENQIKK